jgi:hypothetical protein
MRVIPSNLGDVQQAPRHAEVNQERATGFESDNYILSATVDGFDSLAGELSGDFDRVLRARQTRVEDLDPVEATADEHGLEPTADGLDLRQLGHRARVVRRGYVRTSRITGRSGGGSSAIVYASRSSGVTSSAAASVAAWISASASPSATRSPRLRCSTMPTA